MVDRWLNWTNRDSCVILQVFGEEFEWIGRMKVTFIFQPLCLLWYWHVNSTVQGNFAYCFLYWLAAKTKISVAFSLTHLKLATAGVPFAYLLKCVSELGFLSQWVCKACVFGERKREISFLKIAGVLWNLEVLCDPFGIWEAPPVLSKVEYSSFPPSPPLKLRLGNLAWLAAFVVCTSGSTAGGFVCCI